MRREQDRDKSPSEHASRGLLSRQESPKGGRAQSLFKLRRNHVDHGPTRRPSARVINDDVRISYSVFYLLKEVRHLIGVDDVQAKS